MASSRIAIEGFTPEQILGLDDEALTDLVLVGKPMVFAAGSAELLGEVRVDGDRLVVQLAHVDGGGEGVLATVTVLCQRYAKLREFTEIEWIVNAVNCANPNPKLRRVLERRGFKVASLPGKGNLYRLVERVN
tara:strand:+ start:45612 stop:46010 length:399 start_codon:yes stop_codon:yes gene_type:complete